MGNTSSSVKYRFPVYGIYRKLRYLKKRGTLLRKRKSPDPVAKRSRKRGTFRKILFLLKRGRLFKKNPVSRSWDTKHSAGGFNFTSDVPVYHDESKYGNRSYRTYRKVRFLISTGKLFRRKPVVPFPAGERPKRNVYRKVRFVLRKQSLSNFSLFGLRRTLRTGLAFLRDQNYIYILVNSTVLYLFAYLFVYLLTQMAVIFAAATFNIDTILYYYDVDFLIRAREWLPDAVKVVYSAGPFASLIIAVLSFIVYAHMVEDNTVVRLFILWVFCHAFMRFFGELLMGSLIGSGIGYVVMFLYFMDTSKMVFSVFDFVFIIFTGVAMSRMFLFSGNIYFGELTHENRNPFMLAQFLLPYILGTLIIMILKIPKISSLEILVNSSMFLLLVPAVIRASGVHDLLFEEGTKRIRIYWYLLFGVVSALFLFRTVLGIGIKF